jgi:hypothetical protein
MARYEIRGPDGARYEVTAPDSMPESAVLERARTELAGGGQAPEAPEMPWGEYLKGLGREAVQGATFDLGDELGLTDRDASQRFGEQHPVMSTIARIAGGVPLFAVGPGAALGRAAMSGGLLRSTAKSAGLGAGAGGLAGFGGGEGGVFDRLPSAAQGAMTGAVLGGAVPPAIAGIGRAAGALAPTADRIAGARATEPLLPFNAGERPVVRGATFVNEMPSPAELGNAQTRALQTIRDAMLRAGKTPEDFERFLQQLDDARRPHSSGAAQDVTFLGDLDESMTRLLGSLARQSPEVGQFIVNTLRARQSGRLPQGADAGRLAQQGIPSRERLDKPLTGEQARDQFGTDFGAGLANVVPTGSRGRIRDWLERFFLIKAKRHHGFGQTGIETMEQAAARADEMSAGNYAAARAAHAGDNFRAQIDDVFTAALDDAAVKEAPTVESVIRSAHGLFRPGNPINLEQFDNIKRVLDNRISALLSKPATVHAGGLLNEVKNRLLTAIDDATGGAKSLYGKARSDHAAAMADMRAYLAGRNVLTENEALRRTGPLADLIADEAAAIRHFKTLTDEQQKHWRQGLVDALVAKLPRDVNRSGLGIFNEERITKLLRETAPTETARRVGTLGRYIDFESRMPETRQTATAGSMTARNVQDDLMLAATEASQNVQRLADMFRGNQSLYQLGERLFTWVWDRAFGVGADAAREAARMLLTANAAERQAVLRQLTAMMPPDRMARFSELTRQLQTSIGAPGAAPIAGAAGMPTPQPSQGGPTYL